GNPTCIHDRNERTVVLTHLTHIATSLADLRHVATHVPDLHQLGYLHLQATVWHAVPVRVQDLLGPLPQEPDNGLPPDLLFDEPQGAQGHVGVRLREQAGGSRAEGEEGPGPSAAPRSG